MTEKHDSPHNSLLDDDISLLAIGATVLRHARSIALLAFLGGAIGFSWALLTPRTFKADAAFLPESGESSSSGIALAASQFGIRLPATGTSWGAPLYVQVLKSRDVLEPMLDDSITVVEQNARHTSIGALFGDPNIPSAARGDAGTRALARAITVSEAKTLGAVNVSVVTAYPSVSLAIVNGLLAGLGRFAIETRKTQASAERQFVDQQTGEASEQLAGAENRLKAFLEANREVGASPQLVFERERLQRDVALKQQLYTGLLQNREEARIREVRNTPVFTVIQSPRLPVTPQSRGLGKKTVLGAFAGALIGIVMAFVTQWFDGVRRMSNPDSVEFFRLASALRPRFLRRTSVTRDGSGPR